MRISVLIVSYQRPQLLRNCLASLGRQDRLPDEVVVVGVDEDNATSEVVQGFAETSSLRCRWLSTLVPNVVEQTNLGLEHCDSGIVAFTNDDAEPYHDWLARIEGYYRDEAIGGVGGRDLIHVGRGRILDGQADCVGRITWFGRVYGNHHLFHARVVDVDVLKGVNMSCRRELLRPLDARMAGGGRWHWELDASFQIRRIGKRLVFDPDICVHHFQGPRPGILDPNFIYMANHNLTFNLCKHLGLLRRSAFLVYTFLWGDFPEMGLAVFTKTFLRRLQQSRDWQFIRLLGVSIHGKVDALRALARQAGSP